MTAPRNGTGPSVSPLEPGRIIEAGRRDRTQSSKSRTVVPALDVRLLERTDRRARTAILRAWLVAVAVVRMSAGECPSAAEALRMLAAKGAL